MADDQEHITAREFDNAIRALTTQLTEGFTGVNCRVDDIREELRQMNSKVATQQTDISLLKASSAGQAVLVDEHKRKLEKIDTVTGYRHQRKDDPPPSPDNEPLTIKDLKRFGWVFVTAIVLAVGAMAVVVTMLLQKAGP